MADLTPSAADDFARRSSDFHHINGFAALRQ
jgi:hypothetical protein